MIHFIYGEDTFRSQEALKRIENNFVKKYGDFNIDKLSGNELSKGILASKVATTPFLSEQRLVIVYNLINNGSKEAKDEAISILDNLPSTTELVLYEEGFPDKREKIFKKLDRLPNKQFFNFLDNLELKKWIEGLTKKENFKITAKAVTKLMLYVGQDLFRLRNEILNLISFAKASDHFEICEEDVEKIVESSNNYKIFDLTDAIASGNLKRAILVLKAFRKSGEDEYRIFNLIVHQIRTLALVSDFQNNSSPEKIAKEIGIHPYVVKKTMVSLKTLTQSKIFSMYQKLEAMDLRIKSSLIDVGIAIEMLIVDFCERC